MRPAILKSIGDNAVNCGIRMRFILAMNCTKSFKKQGKEPLGWNHLHHQTLSDILLVTFKLSYYYNQLI